MCAHGVGSSGFCQLASSAGPRLVGRRWSPEHLAHAAPVAGASESAVELSAVQPSLPLSHGVVDSVDNARLFKSVGGGCLQPLWVMA